MGPSEAMQSKANSGLVKVAAQSCENSQPLALGERVAVFRNVTRRALFPSDVGPFLTLVRRGTSAALSEQGKLENVSLNFGGVI